MASADIYKCDDGSVLIALYFKDYRLELCLEENPQESSWHIVSGNTPIRLMEMGQFSAEDLAKFKMTTEELLEIVKGELE